MSLKRPSNLLKTLGRLWPSILIMPFRIILYGIGGISFVHPFAFTRGKVTYGRLCEVGPLVFINAGPRGVTLGEYVQINPGTSLIGNIKVGSRTLIAPSVVIASGGHKFGRGIQPRFSGGHNEHHTVEIGEDVWIGANVLIAGNVKIGRGSVISAGCSVTQDVPDLSLVKRNGMNPIVTELL
jgi:acetyltransferase-like isoleucine patch superfamily enzyme